MIKRIISSLLILLLCIPCPVQASTYISEDTVASLSAAQNYNKIILVSVSSTASRKCTVQMFIKNEEQIPVTTENIEETEEITYDTVTIWDEVIHTTGYVGKNGINKKKEGDKKTPTGLYTFVKLFGIKSNPGTILSYTKLTKYMYWCGGKTYYNRFVNDKTCSKHKKKCSHKLDEHLYNCKTVYNYAAALSYNNKHVYGKGSAIFMHCKRSTTAYTAGCIAVSESNMKKVMKLIDSNTCIIIDQCANITNLKY